MLKLALLCYALCSGVQRSHRAVYGQGDGRPQRKNACHAQAHACRGLVGVATRTVGNAQPP